MQNLSKNFFIILLTLISLEVFSQKITPKQHFSHKVTSADSLFEHKKYIEAFLIYDSLFTYSDQFSPKMLLKMAFIKEGLGDYTKALYYLNVFYTYHPDKRVLKKMEELAAKYKLSGYNYTDIEYFMSLYNQYYYYIIYFFLFSAFTFYVYLFIKTLRKRRLGLRPVFFATILAFVYYITNYNILPQKGIIGTDKAPMMSAPSAGADMVAFAEKGNRVTVKGKEDIWYRISWEDHEVYIRESNLLMINDPFQDNGESFSFRK